MQICANVCACVCVFVREKAKWIFVCFVLQDELVYLYTSFVFLFERKEIVWLLQWVINIQKIKMTKMILILQSSYKQLHM